jgi:hypothetical protein
MHHNAAKWGHESEIFGPGAAVEQMRGKRMAQRVRTDIVNAGAKANVFFLVAVGVILIQPEAPKGAMSGIETH